MLGPQSERSPGQRETLSMFTGCQCVLRLPVLEIRYNFNKMSHVLCTYSRKHPVVIRFYLALCGLIHFLHTLWVILTSTNRFCKHRSPRNTHLKQTPCFASYSHAHPQMQTMFFFSWLTVISCAMMNHDEPWVASNTPWRAAGVHACSFRAESEQLSR